VDPSLEKPVGIEVSTDGTRLYVLNEIGTQLQWYWYPLPFVGNPSKTLLYHLESTPLPGNASSGRMSVDTKGNIYTALFDGVFILNPDGQPLAKIHTKGISTSCTLDDRTSTLFIANENKVIKMRPQKDSN
jgi:sugar lactone lactonase YvrE